MTDDDQKRDEVLKRMLATPPNRHEPAKAMPQKTPKPKPKSKGRDDGKD
ncbi:hypothetical protein [Bosea sp. 685]|nr:hypothetical protein [Bosea sp. 685]WNJ88474.1 hypothetical protein RMR04_18895 [Bosea sp. 685]